jgi:hypothetical protein
MLFYATSDPKTVTHKKQGCKKVILWYIAYLATPGFGMYPPDFSPNYSVYFN